MRIQYDPAANAINVKLNDLPVHYTREVNDLVIIDFAEDGQPVSIELLAVRRYIDNPETVSLTVPAKAPEGQS